MVRLPFSQSLIAGGSLFGHEIELDPCVLFHGTSGAHEASIESRGLSGEAALVSKHDVASALTIFDSLHWSGISQGGLPVLRPFSMDHDFANADVKPTFFAETSLRASTFATRDFAGGETTRALRYALDDLWTFLADPILRTAHYRRLRMEHEDLKGSRLYRDWVREPDLEELEERLTVLDELRSRCRNALTAHSHGVVYALRFTAEEMRDLEHRPPMGVRAWSRVSPDHIISKVHLPLDFEPPLFQAIHTQLFRQKSQLLLRHAVKGS